MKKEKKEKSCNKYGWEYKNGRVGILNSEYREEREATDGINSQGRKETTTRTARKQQLQRKQGQLQECNNNYQQ